MSSDKALVDQLAVINQQLRSIDALARLMGERDPCDQDAVEAFATAFRSMATAAGIEVDRALVAQGQSHRGWGELPGADAALRG